MTDEVRIPRFGRNTWKARIPMFGINKVKIPVFERIRSQFQCSEG